MPHSPVIVVGGGPVGLTTAFGLAQAGVSEVLVLDRDTAVGTAPRAMVYLFPVLEGFDRLGLLGDLQAEAVRGPGVTFLDHATGEHFPQMVDVLEGVVAHPYALHLGQDQVSRILLRRLADFPGVRVRYGTEVTGLTQDEDGVSVRVRTAEGEGTLRAAWVVGADGAGSSVRRGLGLEFEGFTWPDRFISTNVRYDFMARGLPIASWRIDQVYGAVIAQINGSGLWRFTFREAGDLPDEGLEQRIHEHFATALPGGGEYELVQFAPYRMHQRAATTFRVGRVVLAGDAAHVTNPIGALGLTGGFLDGFVLSEALAAVIAGQVDESVLDAYAEARRRVFLDRVSPRASQTKRLVFDLPPGPEKEAALAHLRHLSTDRDARREDQLAMRAMATPSLLDSVDAR
ncbi:FAD-dependent oxidoreductase [Actinomadura fibrosa]|uniref:FAD-dependent oxidoreductase n=1 Tax=Actinomadura fibrosa TaxID=111802 RepID=A0ABW2Y1D0_9ACTN|nr:FAD-dependent monooxygenase [Actinomadura fibrosa]